jgi:putative transposase
VRVSAYGRAGLERLARYILRPPFAQARLRLRADGRVALEPKQAWHDGTREPPAGQHGDVDQEDLIAGPVDEHAADGLLPPKR